MGKISHPLDQVEEKRVISGIKLLGEVGCAAAQTPEARNREIPKS
jgi:hypothetical protein